MHTLPTPLSIVLSFQVIPLYTVKGFNVTVFATNGRGNGESVSEVVYVEEDGMCKCVGLLHTYYMDAVYFSTLPLSRRDVV